MPQKQAVLSLKLATAGVQTSPLQEWGTPQNLKNLKTSKPLLPV